MKARELEQSYQRNKKKFHDYINNIKYKSKWDLFTIINPTLSKTPYGSKFTILFFSNEFKYKNILLLFLRKVVKYYIVQIYLLISYVTACWIYKIFYKKKRNNKVRIIMDVFVLVDVINRNNKFTENYLTGLYEVFKEKKIQYTILLRPHQIEKSPFKLIKFFKIINKSPEDFIFEYEFFTVFDFFCLFGLLLIFPFKTLRLIQKEENTTDRVFNQCLIEDIKSFNFSSLTRYILGKKLAKIKEIEKIYSWCEFQVIERSFNYGIRINNNNIELVGLQFFLNYEKYFDAYIDDLDYDMQSSPHIVLVNGKHFIQKRQKVKYSLGVALRFNEIFNFSGIKEEKDSILLGSYFITDTKYMLESVKEFYKIIFKNHPGIDIASLGDFNNNINISEEKIYKLFETAKIVIGTASGTAVEAVACGISVIIIASQDILTINPLVDYGKGKIWDIAYNQQEIKEIYKKLIEYRRNNQDKIKEISLWYRNNFFNEPTRENIIKVLEIKRDLSL